MTFKEFMPLIHKGFDGEIYLVETDRGICNKCVDRADFYSHVKMLDIVFSGNIEVCGIQPYTDNAIIVEYSINKAR